MTEDDTFIVVIAECCTSWEALCVMATQHGVIVPGIPQKYFPYYWYNTATTTTIATATGVTTANYSRATLGTTTNNTTTKTVTFVPVQLHVFDFRTALLSSSVTLWARKCLNVKGCQVHRGQAFSQVIPVSNRRNWQLIIRFSIPLVHKSFKGRLSVERRST